MIEATYNSLPIALALALSPAPLIAMIIILMTPQAKQNVVFYLFGWSLGILVVGFIVFVIPGIDKQERGNSPILAFAQLALAVLFLGTAIWKWIHRPKKGDPVKTQKLFRHLDEFGRFQSLLMGFALSGLNVKNISLIVAGALTIQFLSPTSSAAIFALFVFTVIGTSSLFLVVAIYYLRRNQIDPVFARWKRWLIKHNNTILIVILVIFGSILLRNGLQGVWGTH